VRCITGLPELASFTAVSGEFTSQYHSWLEHGSEVPHTDLLAARTPMTPMLGLQDANAFCSAEWWCLGYRQHTCTSDQDTSGVSEGWHSYLKASDEVTNKVKSRRLDWFLWVLQERVVPYYQAEMCKRQLGTILFRAIFKQSLTCTLYAFCTLMGCTRTRTLAIWPVRCAVCDKAPKAPSTNDDPVYCVLPGLVPFLVACQCGLGVARSTRMQSTDQRTESVLRTLRLAHAYTAYIQCSVRVLVRLCSQTNKQTNTLQPARLGVQ
jgi:hypothetical protein